MSMFLEFVDQQSLFSAAHIKKVLTISFSFASQKHGVAKLLNVLSLGPALDRDYHEDACLLESTDWKSL